MPTNEPIAAAPGQAADEHHHRESGDRQRPSPPGPRQRAGIQARSPALAAEHRRKEERRRQLELIGFEWNQLDSQRENRLSIHHPML